MYEFFSLFSERFEDVLLRTGEHLILTGASIFAAILIGVPLGIIGFRHVKLRQLLLAVTSLFQTIPSLAMLAILLVVIGKIGTIPALIALILYALLPIVRNTIAGLNHISSDINEAGRGLGMTEMQLLWRVQMPLSFPIILAGIRTAAVVTVGIATLSAFIGAGGLGQFINRGLALSNTPLILLGAIPAALLALTVDGLLNVAEWGLRPTPFLQRKKWINKLKPFAVFSPLLLAIAGFALALYPSWVGGNSSDRSRPRITIASKNFTEQFILAELMAQLIEDHTELVVERRFNLGGTMICHNALVEGEVDLYAEYTGTALTAVLEQPVINDPEEAYQVVAERYRNKFDLFWLEPFGFNNTYTLTVRQEDARKRDWKTISDLVSEAGTLKAGFTSEFIEREDGYPGLQSTYDIHFSKVSDLETTLMYEAIREQEVDVICGFATDGRIAAYKLKPLKDDKKFFPPYYAAPVVRSEILKSYSEIRNSLSQLAGLLDETTMQNLNLQVDKYHRSAHSVAREFLQQHQLIRP